MGHILIVDDEPEICWGLERLATKLGHTAQSAASAEQGLELASTREPDLLILDVRLPGMDGLSALAEFRNRWPSLPVILITAYGDLEVAVEAIRRGAFEYLVKPFELAVAARAIQGALAAEVAASASETRKEAAHETRAESPPVLIGVSSPMQEVFRQIALVAPSDACVHLYGESGTGKELVARAIHRYSRRSQGPFIPVHIASLNPSLAESELFGHVRGAFTGAETNHKGLLERANGGTVFLDEVADIPLSLQVKLLRVLEYGEILPVGGNRPVHCQFRVISATHRDLRKLVAEGKFRHDLYYRLVTFEIRLPPLRERSEDIEPLARQFLTQLAAKLGTIPPTWAADFLPALRSRPWWGNVRELRSALEHALILARGGILRPELLPPPLAPQPETSTTEPAQLLAQAVCRWTDKALENPQMQGAIYSRLIQTVEQSLFETVLQRTGGQYLPAARMLGIHRVTLRQKMESYSQIKKDTPQPRAFTEAR